MPLSLRTGGPADAGIVGALHARSRRHAYRDLLPQEVLDRIDPAEQAGRWAQRMQAEGGSHRLVIAEVDGEAVGFAYAGAGALYAIHVDALAQGGGVGRTLLKAARKVLRELGFDHAELWVLKGNEQACRFYERDGWQLSGETRIDEFHGAMTPQLQYVRPLTESVQMWHNPSCSKCALAVQSLSAAQISVTLRPYLTEAPSEIELADVLRRLGMQPWEVCRMGEPAAVALAELPRDAEHCQQWVKAMTVHPELIQRPILLLADGTAVIGRTPEAIAEAIDRS